MRILVLTSRYTATRDIIGEDFGRQTRIFSELKKLNHDIDFLCADYKKKENRNLKLHGINILIRPFSLGQFFRFINQLKSLIKNNKYDLMVATSDPLWGIIGYHYARKHKVRFLYDLHDNYETYLSYGIPFLGMLDKKVIRKSDLVTVVSPSLKKKLSNIRKRDISVIENGADLKLFTPKNKIVSRKKLNLPIDRKIIAYAGTLQKMQGTHILLDAYDKIKGDSESILLVLAGRIRKGSGEKINLNRQGVLWLKKLSQKDVVDLINAADLVVIPNTSNEFTKYCFPYKIVEYMACNANIVATEVGDVSNLLPKKVLCMPNNADELAKIIENNLNSSKTNYRKQAEKYSWQNIVKKLDNIISSAPKS
jgi:glycosyltransferase involved in cell wall biosynthesis|tara:strand:+ start:219 stop:1316 length:1098 start_codon:yes stop_codon:yes gene_type:complete